MPSLPWPHLALAPVQVPDLLGTRANQALHGPRYLTPHYTAPYLALDTGFLLGNIIIILQEKGSSGPPGGL